MYSVSPLYKQQIKSTVRNPSYMKISLDVVDPQAAFNATITGSSSVPFSNVEDIASQFDIITRYSTLEQNRIILDGNNVLPDSSVPYVNQGYLSSSINDLDGNFTIAPKITVNFGTNYYNFVGLTFTFDTQFGTYPESVRVVAYNNTTVVLDVIEYPDTATNWLFNPEVPSCNKIEITALKGGAPYTRFRLENILFGIREFFESDSIISSTWKRNVDFVNAKLPTYDFDFTILDVDRKYDPENPQGIYPFLEERQNVTFYYGYELNNGVIEWIKGGETFTNGKITINSNKIISQITFKTNSILATLTGIYNQGLYRSTPISLYDLAEEVLYYANLPLNSDGANNWDIDESLQNIYTHAPLPKKSIATLLQLIANAGMCVLRITREGTISIIPEPTTISDFTFPMSQMYTAPKINKYPKLQGVDTAVNLITSSGTSTKLTSTNIVNANNTTYEFEYADAISVTAVAGTGLTIIGTPIYYTKMCRITLTGSGTLTINGDKLTYSTKLYNYEYQGVGERCPSANVLITTDSHVKDYALWVKDYAIRSNDYTISDRGFPELDMDNLVFGSSISDTIYGTVYYLEINYDGTISGKTKILTANKVFNHIYDATGTFNAGQVIKLPTMGMS